MATYQVREIIDDQPTFDKPLQEILGDLKIGGAIKVLTPLEYHTTRQRAWYKGPCLNGLSDWTGDSREYWDRKLKATCDGDKLLKRDTFLDEGGKPCTRLTIVGVGKKNMTAFINRIIEEAITQDWQLTPPDPDLRS